MADALIKGAAVREFLVWYAETRGDDALWSAVGHVPAEAKESFEKGRVALGVLPTAWYPAPHIHALLDGITDGMAASERELLVTQACEVVVHRMLSGLYRFIFETIASPNLYARHIQRLWRMLHNTGDREIVLDPDGRGAESLVEHWRGHHPLMCFITVRTMVEVFRAMGLRDVHADTKACVTWGDRCCRTIVTWRP